MCRPTVLFRRAVDNAAADYDRYYDPDPKAHAPYYVIPTTPEELREQRNPTHVESSDGNHRPRLLMLMTARSRMRGELLYADRALAYFDDARERDIRCVQTITDAKGHRALSPSQQDDPDLYAWSTGQQTASSSLVRSTSPLRGNRHDLHRC
ncbi:MAG: 4-hydroxyphenylacetate 3-hydroxylase N-terminal domain-containing protein [Ilumatobacteraceae bacterium]